jgi:hypothetical protein
MNDLRDLFERVSEPRHDWLADSAALVHEGRRRVRRRRLVGGAMTSVAVLVLGGVAHSQFAGSSWKEVAPAGAPYAELDLTPLSNAEVEARCVSAVKLMDPDAPTDFVVPDSITQPNPGIKTDGHEFQTPKPWHVGTRVLAMPRTHEEWLRYGEPTACTIPEAGRTAQAITRVGTVAQLRGDCGDNLGIGLDGWQQLTASSDGTDAVALFRSGNGYLVHCYAIDASAPTDVQGQALVFQEDGPGSSDDRYSPSALCWGDTSGPINCFGDGRIDDHSVDQVDVTLPSGRVVRTGAVDGYWSVTVRDDASGRWRAKPGTTFETAPVP